MKSKKGRVLFVEDERAIVDMFHAYFEQHGYDFLTTKDIKEALLVTEVEQPDVVLLDIIIPKEEDGWINVIAEQGWDYLEAVKKNPKTKDVPIIVFTNLNTIKDRLRSTEMGAVAYLFKGDTSPQELLNVIDEVIKREREKEKTEKEEK